MKSVSCPPNKTQVALLRVLQEREFERLGGSQPIRADVRVIAATNRNMENAIAAGCFRSDLFYRLNVFPIEMPPLRDRKEDIPTLIEYFIYRYSRKAGKKIANIEKRTLELLASYAWPGNIRELQNVIERSVIVCETDLFSVDPSWLSGRTLPPLSGTGAVGKKYCLPGAGSDRIGIGRHRRARLWTVRGRRRDSACPPPPWNRRSVP